MRAAIYSRKSKFSEKGESVENQVQLCKEYALSCGYEVDDTNIYEDDGFSGKNIERPKFQKLLKDAKLKKFDALICYRLDRLARNVLDFNKIVEELKKLKIEFISIREQFDTSTPMGRAMMNIAAVFAQLERETIAERIKDNMLELAKTGRWLGGTAPLGYKSESITYNNPDGKQKKMFRLVQVPEEVDIVTQIYKLFLEKKSYFKVSSYLCANYITGKNGGEFSRTTVEQIIKNPVYAVYDQKLINYLKSKNVMVYGESDCNHGAMAYNKRINGKKERPMNEWVIAKGKHEAIISSDIWIKSQHISEEIKEKASPRQGTSARALLSGLFICGHCGSGMGVTSKTVKDGKVNYYYRCNLRNRVSTRCTNQNASGPLIDQYVIDYLKALDVNYIIQDYEMHKKTINASYTINDQIANINSIIENNNKTIQGLVRKLALIDDDLIPIIQQEINNIKNENLDYGIKIKEMETQLEEVNFTKYSADEVIERFENFSKFIDLAETVEEKRNLISSVIEHVVWDSEAEKLDIYLIGSQKDLRKGIVNPRLRFGIGSRHDLCINATNLKTIPIEINLKTVH